jgi:hypothetical protein
MLRVLSYGLTGSYLFGAIAPLPLPPPALYLLFCVGNDVAGSSTAGLHGMTSVIFVLSVCVWLYSPFVGLWPLSQFLDLLHSR